MKYFGRWFELSGDIKHDYIIHNYITYAINCPISSNVFTIYDQDAGTDLAIKICKKHSGKLVKRFEREISAIKLANSKGLDHVVKLHFNGSINIDGNNFLYYAMEKADYDLKTYIRENQLDITEKFKLCKDLLLAIMKLHDLNIYHRDIKPENVLFINNHWKIADLGLIAYRQMDSKADRKNEKIGPYGWLSPESTNKVYTEGVELYNFDCNIDNKSDVFQLGKLFWFVFQGNIPVGQIQFSDFIEGVEEMFQVIFSMLQYCKSRRSSVNDVEAMLLPLNKLYAC
jgi:serine/threonine protein kinase